MLNLLFKEIEEPKLKTVKTVTMVELDYRWATARQDETLGGNLFREERLGYGAKFVTHL